MLSADNTSQQWTQADYMRLLNSLFQQDTAYAFVENAFKFFEANFSTHPNLINILLDYYFIYGINSTTNNDANFAYNMNTLSNSRSIIDLICLIPDSLVNKLYDKILEFMVKFPMQQPQVEVSTNCTTNFFERVTNLLILLCYRRKTWLDKLPAHKLLNNVINVLKANINQTELITVHTSLLLVLLINSHATQMFSQHAESLFQIFVNLFGYQTSLEKRNSVAKRSTGDPPVSDIVLSSVKWSIRLYFYVLYGFNASQLIHFLKKKDPQILTKESFTQIFFYLRLNPSLLKEKFSDTDRQFKQQHHLSYDDLSLEWRRYCLDPLCTNYNQVIQNMQKSVNNPKTHELSVINNFFSTNSCNGSNYKHLMTPTPHTDQFNQFLSLHTVINNVQPLLSPSYLFNTKNSSNSNSTRDGNHAPLSVTTSNQATPNSLTSQVTFSYPNDQPQSIQNLTAQFMMNEEPEPANQYKINVNLTHKGDILSPDSVARACSSLKRIKSKSDTNLYYESANQKSLFKSIPFNRVETKKILMPLNSGEIGSLLLQQRRQTSSDAKELRLIDIGQQPHQVAKSKDENCRAAVRMDEFIQTLSGSVCPVDGTKSVPQVETFDVVKAYFKDLVTLRNQLDTNKSPNSVSATSKLKEEMNHLVLQLVYERHLREKYEEEANRLHFIQIERDQLLIEKQFTEKKLKQLVEQYKNEVEESLSSQNRLEISAYKEEVDEKNKLIERLQSKLEENCVEIKDLKQRFDDLKTDYTKIEKEFGESVQTTASEKNLKTKHEIDYQYVNALKYTTDLLRKKLLLLSKSQFNLKMHYHQQQQATYNQELIDTSNLYSITNSTNNIGYNDQKFSQINPQYSYQQSVIKSLKSELDEMTEKYNDLLVVHNLNAVELEECRRSVALKDAKMEELNQLIQMDSIEMNAEIMRNQYRVYTSLMNVNKRLEEEILKLKACLNEKTLRLDKLEGKHADQGLEVQQLLEHIKNKETVAKNF